MDFLDITMTAVLRKDILDRTLRSFKENLFRDFPCRLIINIDPVGDDKIIDVMTTALKYFDCHFNIPEHPNFSKAYKWVFTQAQSEYIFHLEDDWELLKPLKLEDMFSLMNRRKDLATLRLPYRISTERSKNWTTFFDFDGDVFICPSNEKLSVGFCGHPSLIRKSFMDNCVPFINTDKNPEKQFHYGPKPIMNQVLKYNYGVYQKPYEKEYVKDIGRHWLIKTKWRKQGIKAFFTRWERIPETEQLEG